MPPTFILPVKTHNAIVTAAYRHRGFTEGEAAAAARFSEFTAWHGIKTHNAIKALHLDDHFGSKAGGGGGCVPGATIEKLPSRFKAVQTWNANRKLGQAVAYEAMDTAMKLADEFGIGAVAVDNAFHYLWGGGYVIDAANKGYIAYTNCTAALAEVVPFGGKFPTLGTNPHSWAFPTKPILGYSLCIDWATSVVAMGRIQQFIRENKPVPAGWGVDAEGNPTTDPSKIKALFPFGQHKGYGLSLIDELYAAYIGGSLPTLRNRWDKINAPLVVQASKPARHPSSPPTQSVGPTDASPGEKGTCTFYFQCIHPEAISGHAFAAGRSQSANVQAILADILAHGNESCLLPGQLEAQGAALSQKHNGLLFTPAEIEALTQIAQEAGTTLDASTLKTIDL